MGAFALSPSAQSASAPEPAAPATTLTTAALLRPAASTPPGERFFPAAPPARPRPARRAFPVARVRSSVRLRSRPRGPVDVTAVARTEFGSPRVLGVARRRGAWLGVVATERPNGRLAWVRRDDPGLRTRRVRYSLHADLSSRRLVLERDGRVIRRLKVAIGRPGSPTPTGRFAITDKLSGPRFGSYYGCCILALSGKQPNPPSGWPGGNRLAIHGTSSPGTIGQAGSAGCLRAGDSGLRFLMRRVPLGTPVFIRR